MICVACGIGVRRKFGTAVQCWASCFLTDANHQPDRLRNRSQLLPRWRVTSSSIRSSKNSRPASPGSIYRSVRVFAVERIQRLNGRVIARRATGRICPFTGWPMKTARVSLVSCLVVVLSVLASSAYNSGRWYTAPSAAVSDGAICPTCGRRRHPAGDDGKDGVDAGAHGGIFIQRRVNRGAGAVGVRAGNTNNAGAVRAGLRPHLVVVRASDSPSITTGVTMPCRSSPSRRYIFRPGDRNRRRG